MIRATDKDQSSSNSPIHFSIPTESSNMLNFSIRERGGALASPVIHPSFLPHQFCSSPSRSMSRHISSFITLIHLSLMSHSTPVNTANSLVLRQSVLSFRSFVLFSASICWFLICFKEWLTPKLKCIHHSCLTKPVCCYFCSGTQKEKLECLE